MRKHIELLVAAALAIAAVPALAHHSNSAYQVDKIITLTGTVKEWRWMNPHTWLYLTVKGANGKEQEWAIEGRPPGILGRAGWSARSQARRQGHRAREPCEERRPDGIIARVTMADGTVLGNTPDFNRRPPPTRATGAAKPSTADRPSFAGVYYPAQGEGGPRPPPPRPGEPLPPPTRSSPTADGSQGRGPDAPKLTPEYLAKWNVIAKSRIRGSYEYDNIANCLPPGCPQ